MSKVWTIVATVLAMVVKSMTPEIESAIEKFIIGLYRQAKATPNAFDDIGVEMLADLMDINLQK